MKTKQIWAITSRELSIRHKWWKDLLSLLIVFIIIFGVGEGINLIASQNTTDYSLFFVSGMFFYMVAITALATGTDIVIDRRGFNKILLISPISRSSIILGKVVYLGISVLKNYLVFLILALIYFNKFTIGKVLLSTILMIVIALIYIGIAYVFAGIIRTRTGAETALSIMTIITLLLSGIFYPIEKIPVPIKYIFYINPGTYLTDMFRFILTGQSNINPVTNTIIIILLSTIFVFGGMRLFEYRLRKYGI